MKAPRARACGLDLKLRARFYNPSTTNSGRKLCGGEEEKKDVNEAYYLMLNLLIMLPILFFLSN